MILDVQSLNVAFRGADGEVPILRDISLSVAENRCVGVLGESGSGKSMMWKAMLGLLDENFRVEGRALFHGCNLFDLDAAERRRIRGKEIAAILQHPMTAFDPLFTIRHQMVETFRSHAAMTKKEAYELSVRTLHTMRLKDPETVLGKYRHELSGGMLQRIMIGLAVAMGPSIIIADEPTTAIDRVNQTAVIEEFRTLRTDHNLSMIFISHDLGVLSRIADELVVMAGGRIVETGSVEEVMHRPRHPETKHLVDTRMLLLERFKTHTEGVASNA